jgi:phosphonate transport system substrate-binding protein
MLRTCPLWLRPISRILHAFAPAARKPPTARRPVPGSRSRRAVLLGLLLLAAGSRPAAAADDPLVFGIFPNMTAKQIVETYRPLADALEKALHRRVVIYTARDFTTFAERTRRGDYDLLLTAPHLAWLARQEAGYRPLLKYAQPVRGLLVVKADSPIDTPEALRGRTIATADSVAVVVLAIQAELAARGFRSGIDYRTSDSGTHLNAVMQLINGRADAAMLGLHPYKLMPPGLHRQLRVIVETAPLSSLMYLTHPRLRNAETQAVRKALLDFAATPTGQAFLQRGGYEAFAHVDGNELSSFRPYAMQAQEMLRKAR